MKPKQTIPNHILNLKLDDLIPAWPNPLYNYRVHGRIRGVLPHVSDKPLLTVRDLLTVRKESFVGRPNLGRESLAEFERILSRINIRLAGPYDDSAKYFGPVEEPHAIYTLAMHEETVVDESTSAMRVPGGWIYKIKTADTQMNICFIPASLH